MTFQKEHGNNHYNALDMNDNFDPSISDDKQVERYIFGTMEEFLTCFKNVSLFLCDFLPEFTLVDVIVWCINSSSSRS